MAPRRTRNLETAESGVRQTIVETLVAPRLTGISTEDFVSFKQKREVYERCVLEKSTEQGHTIPVTSYRNSIDKPILDIFMTAEWVPAATVSEITETQLRQCIEERARIKTEDYDLAQIEDGISKIRTKKEIKLLEMQVWHLWLDYFTTLEGLGYTKFIDTHPRLAIGHILKRLAHEQLRKRMKLTLNLRKEEFKNDYKLFIREIAKEAQSLDRHDAANVSRSVIRL